MEKERNERHPDVQRFVDWAYGSDISCMFARMMFIDPRRYSIREVVVSETLIDEASAATARAMTSSTLDPKVEALFVYLPHFVKSEPIRQFMKELSKSRGWKLTSEPIEFLSELIDLYQLRVQVGHDGISECLSEAVAFAPLDVLPVSRRAPFLCLTIRTKPKGSLKPMPGEVERRANLAAVPSLLPAGAFERVWEKTVRLRAEKVGADNPIARARNTIALCRRDS